MILRPHSCTQGRRQCVVAKVCVVTKVDKKLVLWSELRASILRPALLTRDGIPKHESGCCQSPRPVPWH